MHTNRRQHAFDIWRAGVDAVLPERLIAAQVRLEGSTLVCCGREHTLSSDSKLAVIGAGKAGAGMALAIEEVIGDRLPPERRVGWVNVPADCVVPSRWIHLHPGRPAGVNEPTPAAVAGTEEILRLAASLTPDDLCLVLLSGGGSALLTAPREGVSLEDKLAATRLLSSRGASIQELNCVRRSLSRVKGGGLLRACSGRLLALVISDVIGDPLETIASGPCIPNPTTAADALAVLHRFIPDQTELPAAIWRTLQQDCESSVSPPPASPSLMAEAAARHCIIGNNETARTAAARRARELGYEVLPLRAEDQGFARDTGAALAIEARQLRERARREGRSFCLVTGGEPVVQLASSEERGLGGRNQELALAALMELWDDGLTGITLLSGGADGEDGPTDAAGACIDSGVLRDARARGLDPAPFLRRNDSYRFFDPLGALLRTGPTHTNVMDLRVVLATPED